MTSNMKFLLAVSSAKSFVSAEEKKEMGGWWSCHHFDAQVHLSSPLKPVEIEAACHLPLRKSNQRRLPIKPISTDEMEADSLLFCFALTATRRPPLSLHRGVFVCHSTFSRWVRCDLSSVSVIHSTPTPPLSLWTPSITCPSERVAWQWCWWGYADCQDGLLPWETRPHTCTHNGCVTHKHTGRITRACIHPYSQHTIAHMHDCTIADSAAHMHGPVNSWACQPKVAQSDTVFQLETGQGRHHASAASTLTWNAHTHLSYFLPFTHAYLSTLV